MQPVEVSGQMFSDQTGIFPRFFSRGNRSVIVLYDYNSNTILTKTLKNNTIPELVRSQTRMIQYLLDLGMKPSSLRIENEFPLAQEHFIMANSVNFQLCPPNGHHTNQEEKSIYTCEFHFLARISWVDPNSPLHLWCCLLPQDIQTLNLLHRSRINPRSSVEDQLTGVFD